ncbi:MULTISPECIES: glycosyltransferase [unclassified Pseudomonas]|uniref:glycosyltransferase n=1 Tax=unclassified Pseudomonas TaxID=196821 RepID=UPI002AC95120|nr:MULTISPECIES: glycosyltransferase [unclassified Pseudomonas]MEB0042407.1 glycosyltransferase [Pseudomonas sp. MH10]MEB0122102.1 glycosyltransferase [Pseudomonas sp. CCI1.2]WPX65726.1 glycosyltransferase [Pseudomonas sp. MH10]
MTHKTTLVTLTYGDRLPYLQTLVSRSLASSQIERVIIVSNASVAPLESLTRAWPGQVEVIYLQQNTGSAKGYSVGIQAAIDAGAEYIWLMDDDNAPTVNAIATLHHCLYKRERIDGRDKAAVLGFRPTHQADIAAGVPKRFAIQRRSSFFGFHIAQLPYKIWRRLPWGHPKAKRNQQPMVQLPFATYGGLLAHRSLYQRIGLPLDALLLYADDSEYTWRITAGGGRIFLVPDALLDDLEESWNIKAKSNNIYESFLLGGSDLRAYYGARNQAWFDKNIWASSSWIYSLNRWVFFRLLRLIAKRRGAEQRLNLIEKAIHDGESGVLGLHQSYPL